MEAYLFIDGVFQERYRIRVLDMGVAKVEPLKETTSSSNKTVMAATKCYDNELLLVGGSIHRTKIDGWHLYIGEEREKAAKLAESIYKQRDGVLKYLAEKCVTYATLDRLLEIGRELGYEE